jgi:hypothetical protein
LDELAAPATIGAKMQSKAGGHGYSLIASGRSWKRNVRGIETGDARNFSAFMCVALRCRRSIVQLAGFAFRRRDDVGDALGAFRAA